MSFSKERWTCRLSARCGWGRDTETSSAKAIEINSEDVLPVERGSLYPALDGLLKRRWTMVEEGTSENNRRAKF